MPHALHDGPSPTSKQDFTNTTNPSLPVILHLPNLLQPYLLLRPNIRNGMEQESN